MAFLDVLDFYGSFREGIDEHGRPIGMPGGFSGNASAALRDAGGVFGNKVLSVLGKVEKAGENVIDGVSGLSGLLANPWVLVGGAVAVIVILKVL